RFRPWPSYGSSGASFRSPSVDAALDHGRRGRPQCRLRPRLGAPAARAPDAGEEGPGGEGLTIEPRLPTGIGAARPRAAERETGPARRSDALELVASDGISPPAPHLRPTDRRLGTGLLLPLGRTRLRDDLHHAALSHHA